MNPLDNQEMLQVLRQTLTKKRVLIVDRHPPARDSLRLMLGAIGVTAVHGAGSAAEVVRQARSHRFDIILSDFVLDDGRDGQQLLEELRHARLIPLATVYMIVTSERSFSNVVALAELTPDDYLVRPFTAEQMQIRLVKAIYKKHVLRKIYEQIERGALQEAIAACDQVMERESQYLYDALRFKGELLQSLGRTDEAEAIYRQALEGRAAPWARMGLAAVLRDRGALEEAGKLAEEVLQETPNLLSAYDFLATVHEARGDLAAAQEALEKGAKASPHNSMRQRQMGDVAARNNDLLTAEKAYSKALARSKGSSLCAIDDFVNLSRVLVGRGDLAASRKLISDMKRERRGDKQAELASLVAESLCLTAEGTPDKAKDLVKLALELQQEIEKEADPWRQPPSTRLAVDLAEACYATGEATAGDRLMHQAAVENHEDKHLLDQINRAFEKTGQPDAGKALLEKVSREIIELNNRGVLAARDGDLTGSVQMLIKTAEKVPNLQFLVNAAKAIYTLMDRDGWDEELAALAYGYLMRARQKDRKSPRVISALELYGDVARKYDMPIEQPDARPVTS
ncbi:MAG: response regulator [Azonexus sp.]|jgi:DNA-binding response OmpR family regulator|nr:response regulator [Azonexus sp.]